MPSVFLRLEFGSIARQISATAFVIILAGSAFAPELIAGSKRRLKTKRLRTVRMVCPEELRGSKEVRIAQNIKAINLGIDQISTESELLVMADDGELVELKSSDYHLIDRGMTSARKVRIGKKIIICPSRENRIFVRTEVKTYLENLAKDFFAFTEFHKRLKITSGARNLEEHIRMRTKNSCYYTPYAAKVLANPLEESLHVRGVAVDVSRRVVTVIKGKIKDMPMTVEEIGWMRKRLLADKLKEGVEPIEESVCYHIVIFPK